MCIDVYKMYNLKDIIRINQEIGEEGNLANRSALEFALDRIHKEKSWLRQAAFIERALLCDHAFQDGNKRTAFAIFALMTRLGKWECDQEMLLKSVHIIARKSITSISKIERLLKNALIRKID